MSPAERHELYFKAIANARVALATVEDVGDAEAIRMLTQESIAWSTLALAVRPERVK